MLLVSQINLRLDTLTNSKVWRRDEFEALELTPQNSVIDRMWEQPAPVEMVDHNILPMAREQDVEVEQGHEVHTQESSCQKAAISTNELSTREETGVHSQHYSTQKAPVPAAELETGGESEVHTQQLSPQKATLPENEPEDSLMTDQAPIEGRSQSQLSDDQLELQVISTNRVLRSASKRQGNAVRTKEPNIKDQEAKASSVEENLVNVEARLQNYESELKDTQEKLAASKLALEETKGLLQSKAKDMAACRRKLRESKAFSRRIKKINSDLEETLKTSRQELSECVNDLFSLQGVAQTPDSTISRWFESICQQIIHWIDMEVAAFEKAHPEAEPDHVFSAGELGGMKEFLRLHPGAGEHLARFLIHRLLQLHVFGKKVYLFGLPEETAQLLREAELKLAELDPPRGIQPHVDSRVRRLQRTDSVAIASWRSETLKALDKTTKCGDYCQQQLRELNCTLLNKLFTALPVLFSRPQTYATFYDQVLYPAVKLANAIRMSTTDYVVSIPESLLIKNSRPVAITMDMLERHKIVDFKSGKQLKPNTALVVDKDGVIGNFIVLLEPSLYRVSKGRLTNLHLGTILVELNHPLPERIKAST